MPRCAKSFHKTVLMLPSGSMANEPPRDGGGTPTSLCPVSVFAETAPSTVAMNAGVGVVVPAPVVPKAGAPASTVGFVWLPPAQPPPPATWMRRFQFAGVGSQISMPIPGDVDGAPAGPGFPG